MNQLIADIYSGLRMLLKYPTLSIVSVLTFGLGIGLSTTVFCVVNGGLLKGLPFPDADRIVAIVATRPAQNQPLLPINAHDVGVWQTRQTSFERVGAYTITALNLSTEPGRPERFSAGQLTVAAFETLGVQPILGRGLQAGDDLPGAEPVIILGYEVWRDRYYSARDIVGRTIRAGRIPRTVVGVMPEKFAFPLREMLWIPLTVDPASAPREQSAWYQLVARLKPEVTLAEAKAQAATIASQLERDFPATNRGLAADVLPYARTVLNAEVHNLLYTMFIAGLGVLLIACVNVSNLLAARASLRRREVAVRMALGAGRSRVIRQHLTEVLVLAAVGGALGVLMSIGGIRWFTQALAVSPPPFWITFDLDHRVLSFVLFVIVGASLAAGALPALHAARVSAGAALKDDARTTTNARLGRASGVLVVVELALSCGLLIVAGLMVKSVVQLKNVPMPFAIDNILTARLDLPRMMFADAAARSQFMERLHGSLGTIPGVEAAAVSDGLPAAGRGLGQVEIEGRAYPQASDYPLARMDTVTAGYFETFGTSALRGRLFAASDDRASQPVTIVNESFARTHFAGGDPIGRRIRRARVAGAPWLTVVGVVPDLLMQGIGNTNASGAGYYVPLPQGDIAQSVRLALRTRGDPVGITPFVRSAVASLDGDLAIHDVHTMRWVIDRQTWFYTVFGTFFTAFGICALLLAAAGLYGVVSFGVTQRTREMGVRSALGAQNKQLVLLIMRTSVVQLTIGLLIGLAIALFATGWLQPFLYRVNPRDMAVFAAVLVTLSVVGLLATFLPAWRVTKIDPALALTNE